MYFIALVMVSGIVRALFEKYFGWNF